jgi:transposase InsO family protein
MDLPRVRSAGGIRTDNGVPFASAALGGLSRLSVWFIKLGIRPERILPGHPEQNGRHERMHRTLKEAAVNPPKHNLVEQRKKIREQFIRELGLPYKHCLKVPDSGLLPWMKNLLHVQKRLWRSVPTSKKGKMS